jgi:hypothetical protein
VPRAFFIEHQPDHIGARFGSSLGIRHIRNPADFDFDAHRAASAFHVARDFSTVFPARSKPLSSERFLKCVFTGRLLESKLLIRMHTITTLEHKQNNQRVMNKSVVRFFSAISRNPSQRRIPWSPEKKLLVAV